MEISQNLLDEGWKIEITPVNPLDYGIDFEKIQVEDVESNPNLFPRGLDPDDKDLYLVLTEFAIEVVRLIAVKYYIAVIIL